MSRLASWACIAKSYIAFFSEPGKSAVVFQSFNTCNNCKVLWSSGDAEICRATRRHDNSGLVWSSRGKKLFLRDIQMVSESGISKSGGLLVTRKRSFRAIESGSRSETRSIKRRVLVVRSKSLVV